MSAGESLPHTPKDHVVRMESSMGGPRCGRLLSHSGHSFAMSGRKNSLRQMKDWIGRLGLGQFESVFVVPMRN